MYNLYYKYIINSRYYINIKRKKFNEIYKYMLFQLKEHKIRSWNYV